MPYCTMMPACCGDREGRCGSPNCKPSVSNTTTAVSTQMRSGRFLRIHQPPSQSSQYRARRFCYCPPALSSQRNPEPERQDSPEDPLLSSRGTAQILPVGRIIRLLPKAVPEAVQRSP